MVSSRWRGGSRILNDLVVGRLDSSMDHATVGQRQIPTTLAEAETTK
jgi:hypothetical protein